MRCSPVLLLVLLLALCMNERAVAMRPMKGRRNATCILVFGDSTVDPGNNNHLPSASKANFPPYGMDYFGHKATGRFSDGRLATDFISEFLGISESIPAFLDPDLQPEQLKNGVSFASASSGYDSLTSSYANVFSFSQQIKYLLHYKIHLSKLVGPKKADEIVKNALVIVSAGTNDIMENYYIYPDRPKQFTVPEYNDYLVSLMLNYTKEIHRVGARRFLVVGMPPIGCLPLIKTLANSEQCVSKFNEVAISFNTKLAAELKLLKKTLGLRTAFLDVYRYVIEAIKDSKKYGFLEISKGCCGTGTYEMGDTCKGQKTCKDPSKYMFWDVVHPTEKTYRYIVEKGMKDILKDVIG